MWLVKQNGLLTTRLACNAKTTNHGIKLLANVPVRETLRRMTKESVSLALLLTLGVQKIKLVLDVLTASHLILKETSAYALKISLT